MKNTSIQGIVILFLVITFTNVVEGQTPELLNFNQERLKINQTAMLVLGGWSVGNIAVSGAFIGRSKGSEKYFHQMNLAWGAINLGIATMGYFGARRIDPAGFDFYGTVHEQQKAKNVFLLNAGLDFAYIGTGAYLWEHSFRIEKHAEQLRGFGQSFVLQGGFLLLFDWVNYFIHSSRDAKIKKLFEKVQFQGNSIGLHLEW